MATANPYVALAQAGVKSILCVRDPMEVTNPQNAFDLTEAQQCVANGVSYTNVPLAHFTMPAASAQPLFNLQAYNAASVINAANYAYPWQIPLLIHCSSGDRASAAFAVWLIAYQNWSNADAANFAKGRLALAGFYDFVVNYAKP